MPKLRSDFPIPISVRVSPELAEHIQKAAEREERTVSGWVRLQLKRLVEAENGPQRQDRVAA